MPAQLLPKLCERGAGSAAIFFGLFLSFSKLRAPGNREAGPVAQLPAKGNSQSLPACWVPPCSGALKILQVQPARRPGGLVGRDHVEIFLQVQHAGRPGSLVLSLKILQVQLPGRPGSLVYTCEIFTSPTTWSTGKSPSERSLLSLLLAAWPAGAGEVGAAHFFWSFLKLSLRLTALGSRPDLAGRPGVLAGGRLQPVRPERPVDDMT